MVRIQLGRGFNSSYKLFVKRNPHLKREVARRIIWFRKNPADTRLANHALKRRMKGKFAFSITRDTRIIYEWLGKSTVRFLAIGGHKQVYRQAR